jgi:hypothetical protein
MSFPTAFLNNACLCVSLEVVLNVWSSMDRNKDDDRICCKVTVTRRLDFSRQMNPELRLNCHSFFTSQLIHPESPTTR